MNIIKHINKYYFLQKIYLNLRNQKVGTINIIYYANKEYASLFDKRGNIFD